MLILHEVVGGSLRDFAPCSSCVCVSERNKPRRFFFTRFHAYLSCTKTLEGVPKIFLVSLVRVGDVQGVSRRHAVRGKKKHQIGVFLGGVEKVEKFIEILALVLPYLPVHFFLFSLFFNYY